MHSSISRFGKGNETRGDYSWAGGCNAVAQHQDDGSVVLNCCAGVNGKPVFESNGSETLSIKAPGALQVATGHKAVPPPTIPPGGHQINSQMRGVYLQLGDGQRTGKNYIAAVQYDRVRSAPGGEFERELVGSWTYFPQREDDWHKLTAAADMRRVPHSFAPGNLSAALDILADRLATMQQQQQQQQEQKQQQGSSCNFVTAIVPAAATEFKGSGSSNSSQVLVERSEQKKLPPALKKFHTMKAAAASAASAHANSNSSSSSSSLAGPGRHLASLYGAPIQLDVKQVHTLRVPVAGSSLGGFSVTLLRVPSTASTFRILKVTDAAFTWRRDSSSGEVLHTTLVQPGMWVRHDSSSSSSVIVGSSSSTSSADASGLLCCSAPTLVSGGDVTCTTLKVKALAICMQGTSKLMLQGCIVSTQSGNSISSSNTSNGVCLSGYIEAIFADAA